MLFALIIGLGRFYKNYSQFAEIYNHNIYLGTSGWSPTNALIGQVAFAFFAFSIACFILIGGALLVEEYKTAGTFLSLGFVTYGIYEIILSVALNSITLTGNPSYLLEGILFAVTGALSILAVKSTESAKGYVIGLVASIIALITVLTVGYSNFSPTETLDAYSLMWKYIVSAIEFSNYRYPLAVLGGSTIILSIIILIVILLSSIKSEGYSYSMISNILSSFLVISGILGLYISVAYNYGLFLSGVSRVLGSSQLLDTSIPILLGIGFPLLLILGIASLQTFQTSLPLKPKVKPKPVGVVVSEKKREEEEEEALEEAIEEIDIEDLDLEL
jgi:hypothetical protein